MKIIYVLAFIPFFISQLFAQNPLDDEVNKMAVMLVSQLNNKKKVNLVAVADFKYQGQQNTKIGKYIADQLNGALMMNGARFGMVNREEVRRSMGLPQQKQAVDVGGLGSDIFNAVEKGANETAVEQRTDLVNVGTSGLNAIKGLIGNANKKLKADVIIRGAIMGQGDNLKVTIEAFRNNRNKDNVAFAKGNLIKTPDVQSLLQGTVAAPVVSTNPVINTVPTTTGSTSTIGGGSLVTPYKHNHLTVELNSCAQSGRNVECNLNVVSSTKDSEIYLYMDNTRIIDANGGYEFRPSEIILADVSTTNNRVRKTLVADIPVNLTIRFTEVNRRLTSIAKMQIRGYIGNGYFTAQLNNIPTN